MKVAATDETPTGEDKPQNQSLTDIVTSAAFILILLLLAVIGVSLFFRLTGKDENESIRSLTFRVAPSGARNVAFTWQVDNHGEGLEIDPEDGKTDGPEEWMFSAQRVESGTWNISVTPVISVSSSNPILASCTATCAAANTRRGVDEEVAVLLRYSTLLEGSRFAEQLTSQAVEGVISDLMTHSSVETLEETYYLRYVLARHLDNDRRDAIVNDVVTRLKRTGNPSAELGQLTEQKLIQMEEQIRKAKGSGERPKPSVWSDLDELVQRAVKAWNKGNRDTRPFKTNGPYQLLLAESVRCRAMKEYFDEEYSSPLPKDFCRFYAGIGVRDPVLIAVSLEMSQLYRVDRTVELTIDLQSGEDSKRAVVSRTLSSVDTGKPIPVANIQLADETAEVQLSPLW